MNEKIKVSESDALAALEGLLNPQTQGNIIMQTVESQVKQGDLISAVRTLDIAAGTFNQRQYREDALQLVEAGDLHYRFKGELGNAVHLLSLGESIAHKLGYAERAKGYRTTIEQLRPQ